MLHADLQDLQDLHDFTSRRDTVTNSHDTVTSEAFSMVEEPYGKPVIQWSVEDCACWLEQTIKTKIVTDIDADPALHIRKRGIDGAALVWFTPPTWEALGITCPLSCAQLTGELKKAIGRGGQETEELNTPGSSIHRGAQYTGELKKNKSRTERVFCTSTHQSHRVSQQAYHLAADSKAEPQLKRTPSRVRRLVGTRMKRLYTTLRLRTIEFPPIDHDLRWVHGITNSGRSPEQIRGVCEQQLDSYMLIYLLVFSTVVPSVLTVLFSDNKTEHSVEWNGILPDLKTIFESIYLLVFSVLSIMFIAIVTHVHYTSALMNAVSDANLITYLKGPGSRLMGEIQAAFLPVYFGTVLLLSMTFAKTAGRDSPWWVYLLICLNGMHLVIMYQFPLLMFHGSAYARIVLHSGLMDAYPLPIAEDALNMTENEVTEILAGYSLENLELYKGEANPPCASVGDLATPVGELASRRVGESGIGESEPHTPEFSENSFPIRKAFTRRSKARTARAKHASVDAEKRASVGVSRRASVDVPRLRRATVDETAICEERLAGGVTPPTDMAFRFTWDGTDYPVDHNLKALDPDIDIQTVPEVKGVIESSMGSFGNMDSFGSFMVRTRNKSDNALEIAV